MVVAANRGPRRTPPNHEKVSLLKSVGSLQQDIEGVITCAVPFAKRGEREGVRTHLHCLSASNGIVVAGGAVGIASGGEVEAGGMSPSQEHAQPQQKSARTSHAAHRRQESHEMVGH
jgi:hypothetical protein